MNLSAEYSMLFLKYFSKEYFNFFYWAGNNTISVVDLIKFRMDLHCIPISYSNSIIVLILNFSCAYLMSSSALRYLPLAIYFLVYLCFCLSNILPASVYLSKKNSSWSAPDFSFSSSYDLSDWSLYLLDWVRFQTRHSLIHISLTIYLTRHLLICFLIFSLYDISP